ncbi:MAG: hypothetical protein SF097_10030 [Acidobacteriota bacterium]|nr:hypothetical protein [Acidobacteriota bacterium]
MSWEPSVRTRHLTVIISLVLIATATLLCFNIARLLNAHTTAKLESFEKIADPLSSFAQRAILTRPLEDQRLAISIDDTVRSLIKTNVGEEKEFAYVSIIATDGAVIAQSSPTTQFAGKIVPMDHLESARWYKQLWQLWRQDHIYEMSWALNLDNKPFAKIVAGVPAAILRNELSPTVKLSLVFGAIIMGLCVLTALLSAGLVLFPLREVMDSIEQLEAESTVHAESRPVNVEMQSIAQRLRELGRRFAGNRTEIEAIRDQLQQVVGSLSERVLLLDRERRVIMASPEAEKC